MEKLKLNGESVVVDHVDRGYVTCLIYDDGSIQYDGPYECYCSDRHMPVWGGNKPNRFDTTYRIAGRGIDESAHTRALIRIAFRTLVYKKEELDEQIERLSKERDTLKKRIDKNIEAHGADYLTGRFGVPREW